LLGQIVHHRPRHIEWILKEQPLVPHRPDLQRHPETVRILTRPRDHIPVERIKEEELLQIRQRRYLAERPVRDPLLIRQKLCRHNTASYDQPPHISCEVINA
jgi:hypothetical protein